MDDFDNDLEIEIYNKEKNRKEYDRYLQLANGDSSIANNFFIASHGYSYDGETK